MDVLDEVGNLIKEIGKLVDLLLELLYNIGVGKRGIIMKKTYKEVVICEIEWGTEQEDGSCPDAETIGLPDQVKVNIEEDLGLTTQDFIDANAESSTDVGYTGAENKVNEVITEWLSNKFGYCVWGFGWEEAYNPAN